MFRRAPSGRWPDPPVPRAEDVEAAVALISSHEYVTPLLPSRSLSLRWDRSVFVKLETLSPIRSFKHRGAVVAVERIAREGTAHTVVTASTGNHGQGVAYAASRAGLRAVVYSPTTAAPHKLEAMRALGADVRVTGEDIWQAQQAADAAAGGGVISIEDGESPDLMAGAATVMWEMLSEAEMDTVIVPVGGGNLIAGSLLVREMRGAETSVVAVQSTSAPAVVESWSTGDLVEAPCETFAGGLATTRPGRLSLDVMLAFLDTAVLVDDDDLLAGIATALMTGGVEVEGAAAATIAALDRFGSEIAGDRVGLLLSGGWASPQELASAIALIDRP